MNAKPPPISRLPNSRGGLAIASLVLGIVALLLSVALIGSLFGLVGIVLGAMHLLRRVECRGMAWSGVALSLIGVCASVALGVFYFRLIQKQFVYQDEWPVESGNFESWHGVEAPDFSVTTLDGVTFTLSDFRGKVVVLNFWATWSPPCLREIPQLIQLRSEIPEAEMVLIGISAEDVETLKTFVAENKITYPVASADSLPPPFRGIEPATTFYIDRRGVIRHVAEGYHDFATMKAQARAADFAGELQPAPVTNPDSTPTNNSL